MANVISIEDFNMSIPTNDGDELRVAVERLGRMLVWHAQNTPAAVWAKAADENWTAGAFWPGKLLHWLNRNRPKREPTAEERATIVELLRGHTLLEEVFAAIIADPDWAIFELSLITDCDRSEEMNVI
ncbi:MAG: hypothetical protein OHM77_06150 [Candidatus Nitricoxidivorans perseverans]|uniref:Uncharacterized protein n=1 Tax=Candidatus Nitricoxidivorans perseverans TaxID=2975601 RepID=A0AA49FNJ6_9PROT|nr:MAG: hypothetical protein OHM77_06150 [Candidatus Nitricoxidivorans perseverans]